MNVLITSAAAKVLLVEAFKEALAGQGQVLTTDLATDCAAAHFSDRHFRVGAVTEPRSISHLIELCEEQSVVLLVPSRDGDLPVFAQRREMFAAVGTHVLVANPATVETCRNKRRFHEFLEQQALPTMPLLDPTKSGMSFPVFVRPIQGAAGAGTRRMDRWEDIEALSDLSEYLIHPFIAVPEYTIDLLMSLDGTTALDAVCRERIHVVAGESKISRVVDLPILVDLACELGRRLRLVGHNTVQMFHDAEVGPMIIEVNPRFGGASNLSIRAGLDSPRRILQMLRGDAEAYTKRDIAIGMTMYRYSRDVLTGS